MLKNKFNILFFYYYIFINLIYIDMITFCINCLERHDRFKQVQNELYNNGFNNIFFIQNKKNINGSKGCFLSHLECYYKLLKSSEDYCLIFEDDVKFINSSKNNYIYIKNIPYLIKNWDLIFLGYINVLSKDVPENLLFIKGIFFQCHSYFINRDTAKKIILYYKKYKQWHHIDFLINMIQNINLFALKNRLCIQRKSKSNNNWFNLKIELITNTNYYEDIQQNPNFIIKFLVNNFILIYLFIIKKIYPVIK